MIISSEYFNKSLPKLPQEDNHVHHHHHNCHSPLQPSVPAEIHIAQPLILPSDANNQLLIAESFMIRSRSTGNVMTSSNILKRQSDIIPLNKKIYNKALPI